MKKHLSWTCSPRTPWRPPGQRQCRLLLSHREQLRPELPARVSPASSSHLPEPMDFHLRGEFSFPRPRYAERARELIHQTPRSLQETQPRTMKTKQTLFRLPKLFSKSYPIYRSGFTSDCWVPSTAATMKPRKLDRNLKERKTSTEEDRGISE